MSQISTLSINLHTGDFDGAGTDGDVYVGLGGREFYLDTSNDDFERNASKVYQLGSGANILHAAYNDPNKPQINTEDLDLYPVYIRFNPKNRDDRWNLSYVDIMVNGAIAYQSLGLDQQGGIWLGIRSGLFYYLKKHRDSRP
ncbi:MAG TPA: hypothetical protein PKM27_05665 [Saprospiraceae bacterium]|nr:hypothetical protein [Saprospiraceae bacterium]HNT19949.1 hypothetical protein [Saprospiraceae bacterium]